MYPTLVPKQRKAFLLLSVGTFVEYFELFLYVHVAELLNRDFFPPTDRSTQQLLVAFSYSILYLFRPLGALLLGYIAKKKGIRYVLILTLSMMVFACLTITILPTYAQIGSAASGLYMVCRIIQGCASLGELIGAEIYVTETLRPPLQYFGVAVLVFCSGLGAFASLSLTQGVLAYGFPWRWAFGVGAGVALLGVVFRKCLPETVLCEKENKIRPAAGRLTGLDRKTAWAYWGLQCSSPVCFYLVYLQGSAILQTHFGYTLSQVVTHNLAVSVLDTLLPLGLAFLSLHVHPFRILRVKLGLTMGLVLALPGVLYLVRTPTQLLLLQYGVLFVWPTLLPAGPIFYRYFSFTSVSLLYTTAHACTKTVTSFGIVYVTRYMGYWGLWVLLLPVIAAYAWGLWYFEGVTHRATQVRK